MKHLFVYKVNFRILVQCTRTVLVTRIHFWYFKNVRKYYLLILVWISSGFSVLYKILSANILIESSLIILPFYIITGIFFKWWFLWTFFLQSINKLSHLYYKFCNYSLNISLQFTVQSLDFRPLNDMKMLSEFNLEKQQKNKHINYVCFSYILKILVHNL